MSDGEKTILFILNKKENDVFAGGFPREDIIFFIKPSGSEVTNE